MKLNLNDLLLKNGIDPARVVIFRHRLQEPALNKVLPWLAAEKPDHYNAIQQTQGAQAEKALLKAEYVASFIGDTAGQALFVGLYKIGANRALTYKQYWNVQAYKELKQAYGLLGFRPEKEGRESILWFDLKMMEVLREWSGRLVVDWPGGERSWYRWAHRNEEVYISCIHAESQLVQAIPDWTEIDLSWAQLSLLPQRWQDVMSQWRGIYYIFDTQSRKGYVGSAYGADNILGRWKNYARSGHGGNKLLRGQDPQHFRFSILQILRQDESAVDVIAQENRWKTRLHSRAPLGLNDN